MNYFHDLARGLKGEDAPKLTPWAAALQKGRRDRSHVDDPYTYCLPLGVPRQNTRSPFKIVQTPSMTIFLHESFVGNTFRQIFTDGRPLPKLSETEPAWLGYSVGRWEGDEFVVESIGFRDAGWLSANMAYPNSDALHVTERFQRVDFGHLNDTVTIDDPKAYVKPWTNKIPAAPPGGHRDPRFVLRQPIDHAVALQHGAAAEGAAQSAGRRREVTSDSPGSARLRL